MDVNTNKCSSDRDLVSLVDWAEEDPTVFINFHRPDKNIFNCYDGKNLIYWLNQPNNIMANWIRNNPDEPIDDMGYGGKPGNKKYYRLYTGEYLKENKYVKNLRKDTRYADYSLYDANYIGTERLGNLQGRFGVSDLHGQLPKESIYEIIKRTNKTELLQGAIENSDYKLIKKLMIQLTLKDLRKTKPLSIASHNLKMLKYLLSPTLTPEGGLTLKDVRRSNIIGKADIKMLKYLLSPKLTPEGGLTLKDVRKADLLPLGNINLIYYLLSPTLTPEGGLTLEDIRDSNIINALSYTGGIEILKYLLSPTLTPEGGLTLEDLRNSNILEDAADHRNVSLIYYLLSPTLTPEGGFTLEDIQNKDGNWLLKTLMKRMVAYLIGHLVRICLASLVLGIKKEDLLRQKFQI
uniref:Uncharacterized protein n=1 Tax=Marseillevirus LCMAC102 TaxID=2506603 RepID=A0A481YTU9_9VIRU|nr:MAG: uncharacterized protein LCMAC102_03140 [Marseillevirus LCMAC102]